METYTTNDGYHMVYRAAGEESLPPLILLHGFTGSSEVFTRNIPALSKYYRVIAPDLRGHGGSAKMAHGFHVSRLAMDLANLLDHLNLSTDRAVRCVAGSLGCAILWCYAELFTPAIFSHMVWVDQAPMQNYAWDGSWGEDMGNRSMNSPAALAGLHAMLDSDPDAVYRGTIEACLGYSSHPVEGVSVPDKIREADEDFFLNIARQGNAKWYGNLMADHTALDWRQSIASSFAGGAANTPEVLVVASSRSGCFPAKGVLEAVKLCNDESRSDGGSRNSGDHAKGVEIDWGGHWCYWEEPNMFNDLVLNFLGRRTIR